MPVTLPLIESTTIYILHVSTKKIATMKTAKIFQHGNSQAVRLPKEFRFDDDEVIVKHHGCGVLLLPKQYALDDLIAVLQGFEGPIERGDDLPPQPRKF